MASEPATERLTPFAEGVLLHVVLHEVGHGLVREFDLPVLGNEETLADAFATHYLTHHLPDRAFAAIQARTDSLMIEAAEVARAEWPVAGEHNNDARRAAQIAALAVAADPDKYTPIARSVGMTDRQIAAAIDYGAEVHRSWRRTLAPLWMPPGQATAEARVVYDPSCPLAAQVRADGLGAEVEAVLRRFDWHSQVRVAFVEGDGGAGWNRSTRTVTVHSDYVRRFVRQGEHATR